MERKELNETLFTKAFETQHNAFLWVGVQGVVALSLLFAPIFLRRTHVNINSGKGNPALPDCAFSLSQPIA
ncbi:hypothetical protein [Leptospira noguchii]|uniref:Uncharacterized protein n=1 Tax=Leptospira noguchii TaxID=28182 RepID=A0AAE9K755_9LEPT|nr:hypothetical protein [Leptospira noguchii]UOG55770.1 hypothetical protein MAL03_12935 [Leptospira noguchii]